VIVGASALIAILFKEEEALAFAQAMQAAPNRAVAAPTVLETAMVAEGRSGPEMGAALDRLLGAMRAEIVPFTAEHAAIARDAWRRYGKGRHPAALNLGDCFAYALAQSRNEPLLFKGADFPLTDVKAAL
jgi:ribonuclease VapC